jgi:hypothetical protein
MPRIRTIKPECHQHEKVGGLSDRRFRLWVGLITQSDDEGRQVASAEQLRTVIWGYHPSVTVKQVEEDLQHLSKLGLIRLYRVQKRRYLDFPTWKVHQRISKPTPSRLPPHPHGQTFRAHPESKFQESSRNTPGALSEPSRRTPHGSDLIGSDLIGKDRKGSDRIGSSTRARARETPQPPTAHLESAPSAGESPNETQSQDETQDQNRLLSTDPEGPRNWQASADRTRRLIEADEAAKRERGE